MDKVSVFLDIHPKNWLKPFQRNSVAYLLKMGLFYHLLGLGLMYLGSNLITEVISDYHPPQFPVSISLALSSGFFEETVFFGIPFYLSGNSLIILGTGIIWSAAHLFNTGLITIQTLAYGAFLFSTPHIFFSLRTWSSGKGWFAILFHSGWNVIFLLFYCGMGLRQCSIVNDSFDYLNIIMAFASVWIVYMAYLNNVKKKFVNRFVFLIPVGIITVGLLFAARNEFIFLW